MLVPQSQLELNQPELLALEADLRSRGLIYQSSVQKYLKRAYGTYHAWVYNFAIDRLRRIIKLYENGDIRTPDSFRPYCPASLIQGIMHILDQMDGLAIQIDPHKLLTGLIIAGPQGQGKSRLIIQICKEFRRLLPQVRITIIDPKGSFSNLSSFRHIDLSRVSLNLAPPPSTNEQDFTYELMSIIGDTAGLIYGQEIVSEATDMALKHLEIYRNHTGLNTHLCLMDTTEELMELRVTGPRRPGYRDAAQTVFSRIIGKSRLFSCRQGLSLGEIVRRNTVIGARHLTDDMQCRFLATYILFWLYQNARLEPETNEIRHIVIIDDASRFIGAVHQFDAHMQTSSLGHILAVLRSTGTCLIVATQLPAHIDPAVLFLSRSMIVVGNINGEDNLRVVKNFMSLNDKQKEDIVRFQKREAIAFISDSAWPYPLHGFTPEITLKEYTTPSPSQDIIEIIPWHPLTCPPIPKTSPPAPPINEPIPPPETAASNATPAYFKTADAADARGSADGATDPGDDLAALDGQFIMDCVHYPFGKSTDHADRLSLSARIFESTKTQAIQNGYLIASSAGKTIYLIPTIKAFDKFGFPCPYTRSTSIEHAFYVALAVHFLKKDSGLSRVQAETPIGDKGATIDVTTTGMDGRLVAYEITLSTSNLSSNAAKLQGTSYERIIWLCRDADTAKAVKAYFNKTATLPAELREKFEYAYFSKWIQEMNKSQEKNHGKTKS